MPAPGEPREGLDPSLPMRQRVAAKAAELDRRSTTARLSHPLAGADPRVIEVITVQHGIGVDDSTGDMTRFKRRVQNRLDAAHGKGEVPLPAMTAFRRWVEVILPGRRGDRVHDADAAERQGHLLALRG